MGLFFLLAPGEWQHHAIAVDWAFLCRADLCFVISHRRRIFYCPPPPPQRWLPFLLKLLLYYFPSKEDKGPLFILRNKNDKTTSCTHAHPRLQIRPAMRLDDHLLIEAPSNLHLSRWGPHTREPQCFSLPLEYSQRALCLCRDSGVSYSPLIAAGQYCVTCPEDSQCLDFLFHTETMSQATRLSEISYSDLRSLWWVYPVLCGCLQECNG